ncbi:MAG: hypothetical protein ACI8RD_011475 [Bacillariaceae sp.]|jgi:hypothetical protein
MYETSVPNSLLTCSLDQNRSYSNAGSFKFNVTGFGAKRIPIEFDEDLIKGEESVRASEI